MIKFTYFTLLFCIISCAGIAQENNNAVAEKKILLELIKKIKSKPLHVITSDGISKGGDGFSVTQYYVNDTLYVYEYYDNKDSLYFETFIFYQEQVVYFENIKTTDYNQRKSKATYINEIYFKEEEIIFLKQKGKISNIHLDKKINKAYILDKGEEILKTWHNYITKVPIRLR